ncbi:MAG TPA: DUF4328 domain-containing protein [Pyrinomonadaceae bacterium]|jgi:heme/copper-type cytochrome/quinol oxidase subunit 2|nr:DUF4328 domain-containing protein [Pyrinomonadaceae bacterium]
MLNETRIDNPPPPEGPKPPEGLKSTEPYQSDRGRALAVTVCLLVYVGVTVLSIVAASLAGYLPGSDVIGAESGEEALTLHDLVMGLVALVTLAVYVPTVVFFCMWVHRAYKNLPALGNPPKYLNYSPRWAVGSFFIPLASLVLPYIIVKEIWDRSDPSVRTEDDLIFTPTGGSPLLLVWWIVWVVSNVLSNIAYRLDAESAPASTQGMLTGLAIFSDIVNIVAAVLCIFVVRAVTARQEERSRHVTYVAQGPPPPPVFSSPAAPQPQP